MAKKQFIRHLEFYGYPDQNTYSSNIGDIDLSDIREKNKQQDEEIQDLEGEKADKKDLIELSGTVENLISTQTAFNNAAVEEFSAITKDIGKLKEIDNEYGQQLSALTDGLNDAICGIQNLGGRIDDVEEDIEALSGKVTTLEGTVGNIQTELDTKLGKDEAEEIYAKKSDVYTKEEVDALIDGELSEYATKEWVEEQGYLDVNEGDERYAKIETVNALSDRLNDSVTDLNTKIYSISGDFGTYKTVTDAKIGSLETNFEVLRGETNRKVNAISATVESCSARVTQNEHDINNLQDDMARKANQADLETLQNTVSNLSDRVDTKVSKEEFNTYKAIVSNEFNNFDDKKADRRELTPIINSVTDVNNRLDEEIAARITGDNQLQSEIDAMDDDIDALKEKDVFYGERLDALESGLTQEIADREQQKVDLIGEETDPITADTIWGAKKYAENENRMAVDEANTYTDNAVSDLGNDINHKLGVLDGKLTGKADITYVDNTKNELKAELEADIADAATEERDRAEQAESGLWVAVRANTQAISSNTYHIDDNANRLNAITSWDGYDPEEYDDSGNGVLDVLHREFHAFVETGGSVKEIKVEDGVFIITYYTPEGEKTVEYPVGELVDLSDYYTKEETDVLLDGKADKEEFIDLSAQVNANTNNIEVLSGTIETLDEKKTDLTVFNALLQKLGYADNETLEKKHENEVAFGTYNASHISEDASGNTIFSIGNGTSNANRSNALEVMEDGSVYMWIEGDYMNINKLLGMLAHETYDDDILHSMNQFFDDEENGN